MIRRLTGLAFVLMLAGSALALDITTCDQTVPADEIGVVQADFSCMGAFVVALERRATLDLNGHVITLATHAGFGQAVVQCNSRRCTVGGPGTITCTGPGGYASGIGMSKGGRLDVNGVDIVGCDQGVWDMGNNAKTRVYAVDVNVHDSTYNGIEAEKLVGTNVTANDNGYSGLAVERVEGTSITVNDNGFGNVVPLSGISSFQGTVRITGLVATGNARYGVQAKKLVLTSSTVTGNQVRDIASTRFPRLIDVTCGTSNWGVCQND